MPKTFPLFFCFFLHTTLSLGQTSPLSNRVANYDMQVNLDPSTKEVKGHQTLLWNNPSSDTIYELQYHLYINAFKNSASTFMKERSILSSSTLANKDHCNWGWIEIIDLKDKSGNDLTEDMSYYQPDDLNELDQTVLRVILEEPVLPFQSTTVEMDWVTHVPRTMARTGYNRDFYFMAQWFPKVGVYEPAGMRFAKQGQWNCHQYHSSGEYYSDFGVYEVAISVPENYLVGASGEMIKEERKNGTATYTYYVEDVIDFAWTTSPHFQVVEDEWNGIKMRLLSYEYNKHFAERYLTATKQALAFFDEKIGKYPYPTLTIVNPPLHGIFCAGMEYPTLFTVIGNCVLPKGVKTPEIIAIHEFIHQYFMQMVASNEQEEAWLDEGITNYYESRIMDIHYGKHTSTVDWMGITFGGMESNRSGFFGMKDPQISPIATFSWQFKDGSYHDLVYTKTALVLQTLSGIVGLETMDEIMSVYFQKWKFKHPGGSDFIQIVNEVVHKNHGDQFGENMNWFFDQLVYDTGLCDYAITNISNEPQLEPFGILEPSNNCEAIVNPQQYTYKSTVQVHRLEEIRIPVDIKIVFDDDSVIWEKWDGKERSKAFIYYGGKQIKSANIDPDRKIYIDKNFSNNSLTTSSQKTGIRKYAIQAMTWIQNTMQSISIFI